MARGPRLIVPGIALHIVQRGHNRRDCFHNDTDYLVYLSNLRELARRTQCALHAYCLMTNHVHLLLTPSNPEGCALLMRNLGQRYVQYFNRRYERSGTLWEGRYHSCLVDSGPYVIACHRYIERNPVRAGMVPSAGDYRWSSHNGNTGRASNTLLTAHPEYLALSADGTSRRAAYEGLFAMGDEPAFLAAIRDATHGGFGLVGERVKGTLPENLRARLERKPSGPRPKPTIEANDRSLEIELELGLRPRIT
jgi:REP-associated tyrosine transposase